MDGFLARAGMTLFCYLRPPIFVDKMRNMPRNRMIAAWWRRQQASRKPRGEMTPLKALERSFPGSVVTGAVFWTLMMIFDGAIEPAKTFGSFADGMVLAGWLLLVWRGIRHRLTRRELRRSYPDLARALARRRWRLPGSGWSVFVFLPLMLIVARVASAAQGIVHPGHSPLFPIWWMAILAPAAVLLWSWYHASIYNPYIRLLQQAVQNAPSAAEPPSSV